MMDGLSGCRYFSKVIFLFCPLIQGQGSGYNQLIVLFFFFRPVVVVERLKVRRPLLAGSVFFCAAQLAYVVGGLLWGAR